MNIFVLHNEPGICAQYHVDRHVVKMPIELTQLMCTIMREQVGIDYEYKSTYVNHPITKWVGLSFDNFYWTWTLALSLFAEYTYRYGRVHASQEVHNGIVDHMLRIQDNLPEFGLTPFHKAVSPRFKKEEPITAYRLYYYFVKDRLHNWTGREVPPFISDHVGGIADKYRIGERYD